jgi:DUF177 domain-containing protein
MFLGLRSLQGDHEHVGKSVGASLFEGAGGDVFRVVSPVTLSFDIDRQEPARYRAAGHVNAELELTCSRCLEAFVLPVTGTFDLRYVPRAAATGDGERELREDDLATAYYDDDQIDLMQLIVEQCQLALPMKPLCSEGCKGLCPQCGANRNAGVCGCSETWEDPRLAALKALAGKAKPEN